MSDTERERDKKLKKAYTDILQDNLYLCEKSIIKSNMLLTSVENLNEATVEEISTGLQKLFDRMTVNLNNFKEQFNAAAKTYKSNRENGRTAKPKRRHLLSLRKTGDTQETDVESSCGEFKTSPIKLSNSITISDSKSDISEVENKADLIDENEGGADLPESDDSQNTIPYSHFDVCINGLKEEGEDDKEQLDKALNLFISQDAQAEGSKTDAEIESSSFDFDDDFRKEAQKNNHELLELLNKTTDGNPNYPEYVTTEQEGDEALQQLEDDASLSSNYSDSDDSNKWSLKESDASDMDVEDADDEEEEEPEIPEVQLKSSSISLTRVDELDDAAIDKLCDLHSLNKRKCKKELKPKKRRFKRVRLLSSSSSSEESDNSSPTTSSSQGSTTPDNLVELEKMPSVCDNINVPEDVTALADELYDKMADSDEEPQVSSESSETDVEEKITKEKKVKEKTNDEDEENYSRENIEEEETDSEVEDNPKKRKKPLSPLLRGPLWTDSSDEFQSDTETKPKLIIEIAEKKSPVIVEDPTVISDSSVSSDDVTFVSEGSHDASISGRGRRNIRAIIGEEELNELTQRAKDQEVQRIQRLEEHSKSMEPILSQHEDFVLDVHDNKPAIIVNARLAKRLKPHQKNGVKFMWEACYESIEAIEKSSPGSGCILAHCMGLGKTFQVITLIHTLFNHPVTKTKHVMIVCPLSTVTNWRNEFKLAFRAMDETPKFRCGYLLNQPLENKIELVKRWRRDEGVIVIGYEAFQHLTREKEKQQSRMTPETKKILREILLDPGPDLVVCDEGHLLKSGKTLRTKSLMDVRTRRRIVLTGTPLQNNLDEYYYMVSFVKEHLLGTETEYKNRFSTPIMNGQYEDSTAEDIKLMKKRTHVLTKLLKKTVDRVETRVLEQYLPEIQDYTIFVKLEPLQIDLYKRYITSLKTGGNVKTTGFFQDFRVTKYITLHPWTIKVYYDGLKSKNKKKEVETIDIDPDEDENANVNPKEDWYKNVFPDDLETNPKYSMKMQLILAIINEIVKNGEKVLIFAHLLPELDVIEKLLQESGCGGQKWRSGVDFYRMDGCVKPEERSVLCNDFNSNPRVKVFLISHRVGGLGLNLTAANRVILIGSNHNPSVDVQSIYRVYRFGQSKEVFVYRLLALGTMEEKVYRRCVVKEAVAGTVVDKFHFKPRYNTGDLQCLYQYDFDNVEERPIPLVPSDKLLASLLTNNDNIYSYHNHKALLENRPEEELNDEEKKNAWDEWDAENAQVAAPPVSVPPAVSTATTLPLDINTTSPSLNTQYPVNIRPPPLLNRPPVSYATNRLNGRFPPHNRLPSYNTPRPRFHRPPPPYYRPPNYPFNQYDWSRMNNEPAGVANPSNFNHRGPPQRGAMPNPGQFRGNNMPQLGRHTNLPQIPSTMYNPQYNSYNRNIPKNSVHPNSFNGQYVRFFQINNRQNNGDRVESVIRANPNPTVASRSNQENVPEASSSGEFNYALNKVIR